MGISQELLEQHMRQWKQYLSKGPYPYREYWPEKLFRHGPIENALEIIRRGTLYSRSRAQESRLLVNDIAPNEIINCRVDAHDYVRMYFRPRNPTQYNIEGIRKPNEIYMGKHAPILVVFLFNAFEVLYRENILFSDGNMQSGVTNTYSTNEEFSALPFHNIYHEGPFSAEQRDAIVRCRCAEVLVPGELSLENSLQAIMCRSSAERATLLHLLGEDAEKWRDRIRVFSKPGLFQAEKSYLSTVECSSDGVVFALHPRRDGAKVSVELWVYDGEGNQVAHLSETELDTMKRWRFPATITGDICTVRFELEGCFAYECSHYVDSSPF